MPSKKYKKKILRKVKPKIKTEIYNLIKDVHIHIKRDGDDKGYLIKELNLLKTSFGFNVIINSCGFYETRRVMKYIINKETECKNKDKVLAILMIASKLFWLEDKGIDTKWFYKMMDN